MGPFFVGGRPPVPRDWKSRPFEAATSSPRVPIRPLSDGCPSQIHCHASMTRSLRSFACVILLLLIAFNLATTQNPQQKPQAGTSFMAPPQSTAADQQNFPAL